MLLLAGDVGGTKTDLGLYSVEGGPRNPLTRAEFPSPSYPSLEASSVSFWQTSANRSIEPVSASLVRSSPVTQGSPTYRGRSTRPRRDRSSD
jgi:glucokinase